MSDQNGTFDKSGWLANKGTSRRVDTDSGAVFVRSLSVGDMQAFAGEGISQMEMLVNLIVVSVVSSDGVRIFSDDEVDALKAMPASSIMPLVEAVLEVNGLDSSEADLLGKQVRTDGL